MDNASGVVWKVRYLSFDTQNTGFQCSIQAQHLKKKLSANSAAPRTSTLDTNTLTVHTSPSMLLNTNISNGQGGLLSDEYIYLYILHVLTDMIYFTTSTSQTAHPSSTRFQ